MVMSVTVALAGGAATTKENQSEKVPVIIMFKDKTDTDLIKQHGGELKCVYHLQPAVAVSLPQKAIEALKKNPKIAFIVPDLEIFTMTETLDWGVDRIDADIVHEYNNGTGVNVAIMDTGIDRYHPDLAANYAGGYDFGGWIWWLGMNDDDPMDFSGHGTHCAGIVAAVKGNDIGVIGVAPEADLYAVKVFDDFGDGRYSDVIEGLEWCIINDIQVISMSFGSAYTGGDPGIEPWINDAYDAGILLVGAAGNDGSGVDTVIYPARYDKVIAVAATDISDNRASFSSTGPDVELSAPGVGIYSTYLGGGYATLSGTSMACPMVSGTAALVIASDSSLTNADVRVRLQSGTAALVIASDSSLTNADVRVRLQQTADYLGAYNLYGHGLVDADEAALPTGNQPPVANAGADQTVSDADGNGVEAVTLDGSGSYDQDGSIDTYEWKEGATLLSSAVSFTRDFSVGMHNVTLTVTDDGGASSSDDVIVTVNANQPPVADAGADQTVSDADGDGVEAVTLDGSGSSDPDGTIDSYEWKEGADVLSNAKSFTRDFSVGTHTVTLTVTDGGGASSSDNVIVTVNANQPPVADAGADQTVSDADGNGVEAVTLDGSGSSDPDGSIDSYVWKEGETSLGSGASFTRDFSVGMHTVTLTVTDDDGANSSDDVIVTVNANQAPVADAGANQTVSDADGNGVEAVTLDGSGSSDPDGSIDSYEWKEGATLLSSAVSFTRDFSVGMHTVTLTVTDDGGANSSDDVIVTVTETPTNTMHVASIDMSKTNKYKAKGWFTYATATVKIVAANGDPVKGATVYGTWSGLTSDSVFGRTGRDGEVALKSDSVKNADGTFTFTVDDVAKNELTYDPNANEATNASTTV
jgi:subtilisin family serine protease